MGSNPTLSAIFIFRLLSRMPLTSVYCRGAFSASFDPLPRGPTPLNISIYNRQKLTSTNGKGFLGKVVAFAPRQRGAVSDTCEVPPFYGLARSGAWDILTPFGVTQGILQPVAKRQDCLQRAAALSLQSSHRL